MTRLVDVKSLARIFGVTPRRIQQLAARGTLPRDRDGEYPLAACVEAWAAYQRTVAAGAEEAGELERLRARRIQAEAAVAEIELALADGSLVRVDEFTARFGDQLSTLRARLLNLPGPLSRLEGVDDPAEVRRVLDQAVDELMEVLEPPDGPEGPEAPA
ncbi:MAG TPA: hypothetical protein VML95_02135 [Longimicrobiales bacterium]|nr:hypothetical protein [Longimicrobiales bacterium]